MLVLMGFGLFKLNMHLGKPHRFYRGFYNLRYSPVSREIAGVSAFFTGLIGYSFLALFDNVLLQMLQAVFAALAVAGAVLGGYFMYKLYRIEARPFWNHWYTAASFLSTALTLGTLLIVTFSLIFNVLNPALSATLMIIICVGLLLEITGLSGHSKNLKSAASEGAVSFYLQTTLYGKSYWLRNILLVSALLTASSLFYLQSTSIIGLGILAGLTLMSNIIGRALFYVVVTPTTMPGAFFWKNQGFVEHARETGLADMPQLGVAYEKHHAFKLDELIDTIKTTTIREKLFQFSRVFTG
jgi:DMSO reductase anchor subunit